MSPKKLWNIGFAISAASFVLPLVAYAMGHWIIALAALFILSLVSGIFTELYTRATRIDRERMENIERDLLEAEFRLRVRQ